MDETGFARILLCDVDAALQRQKCDDNQTSRRDLVRAVFAAIDGVSWLYRQHVAEVLRDLDLLSPEEEIALSEYTVTESGKINPRRRYLPTPATIKLATSLAKRADPALEADFGGEGWEGLRDAIAIRNRVTHPKQVRDMELDKSDISTCLVAFYWLLDIAMRAMEGSTNALRVHNADLRLLLGQLRDGDPEAWAQYMSIKKSLSGD